MVLFPKQINRTKMARSSIGEKEEKKHLRSLSLFLKKGKHPFV